jgi:hypothetical protein
MVTTISVWEELKNAYEGDSCFILGNGNSLANEDSKFLKSMPCFGTNRIYLKLIPDFYVVVNPMVAEQYKSDIEKMPTLKFVTDKVEIPGCVPLHSTPARIFSRSPEKHIYEGYTVTYVCMQLAYYMGFREVFLFGVDHSYKFKGEPNETLVAEGKDPNHFDPDYFTGGKLWNAPDLAESEKSYTIAKRVFEADHRKIYNCTPGSKLDVFERRAGLWD